jgi:hypothetical protein
VSRLGQLYTPQNNTCISTALSYQPRSTDSPPQRSARLDTLTRIPLRGSRCGTTRSCRTSRPGTGHRRLGSPLGVGRVGRQPRRRRGDGSRRASSRSGHREQVAHCYCRSGRIRLVGHQSHVLTEHSSTRRRPSVLSQLDQLVDERVSNGPNGGSFIECIRCESEIPRRKLAIVEDITKVVALWKDHIAHTHRGEFTARP